MDHRGIYWAYGMLVAGIETTIDKVRDNRLQSQEQRDETINYLTDLLKRAKAKSDE